MFNIIYVEVSSMKKEIDIRESKSSIIVKVPGRVDKHVFPASVAGGGDIAARTHIGRNHVSAAAVAADQQIAAAGDMVPLRDPGFHHIHPRRGLVAGHSVTMR